MSDQIVGAVIGAIAMIIGAFISRQSTKYVPVPVISNKKGWLGKITSFGKRILLFVIIAVLFAVIAIIAAGQADIDLNENGLIIGLAVGLVASYYLILR